jgi:hypothetical protein
MNIGAEIKKIAGWGFNALSGKILAVFHPAREPSSPLADRLLADALRLAELPSPADGEEKRSAFIRERLAALGYTLRSGESGSLIIRIAGRGGLRPLLLFAGLRSERWHPTESLAQLDRERASGAGLADALGPAALLSIAEGISSGRLSFRPDIILLFTALPSGDPDNQYRFVIENPEYKPAAAIGVTGFSLGTIVRPKGRARLRITLTEPPAERKTPKLRFAASPPEAPPDAETMIRIAENLLKIHWDDEGEIRFHVRRIEAGSGAGGTLDVEFESFENALLASAIRGLGTAVERIESSAKLTTLSYIPSGDAALNGKLSAILERLMKKKHIKIKKTEGVDPSGFFLSAGIPAIGFGFAVGEEGPDLDTIFIDSVEKGRRLLEQFAAEAGEST